MGTVSVIEGEGLRLRPARPKDREKIYEWLCLSDLTSSVMGPPRYPEHPVPTWEEFCESYPESFFTREGDGAGRVYVILAQGEEVGTVGYDLLDRGKDRVVLDIWMRAERFCGRGFGHRALDALVRHLHGTYGLGTFIISPSARNQRAVAAYRKAGFEPAGLLDRPTQEAEFGISEYDDNLLMIRRIENPVEAYIAGFPPPVRTRLDRLRRTIRAAAPAAVEKISYRMPTYHLNGNLVHFAAYDGHIGFYPTPDAIEAFAEELAAFETSKGAVRFPHDSPLPLDLVKRMVAFRVRANRG